MREFIYFSKKAPTTGNFPQDLKKAGRLDIVCHFVIGTFFVSHAMRKAKLHLVFDGPPDPPKHLEINSTEKMKEFLSKKDVSGLIKRMLYKYKKGKKIEAFPGCFIEKKSFMELCEDLAKEKKLFLLDKDGQDIREVQIPENAVFIFGDHEGLPKKELKKIKEMAKIISLGKITYFASQALAILQNELDRRKIE